MFKFGEGRITTVTVLNLKFILQGDDKEYYCNSSSLSIAEDFATWI